MRGPFAALAAAAALACTPPATEQAAAPPAVDTAAAVQAVGDVWSRLAIADTANDVDAFLALISPEARFDFAGAPPMVGRAAVESALRPQFAAIDYTSMDISPASTTVISNELVYQRGSFVEGFTEKGKASTQYGRYASAIVKEADGQWRVGYLMAITDSVVPRR